MKKYGILLTALVLGAVNAVVYKAFEYLVGHGTNGIWNTWLHSNTARWMVFPIAIVMGVVLTLVVWFCKEDRFILPPPSIADGGNKALPEHTITAVGKTLLVGLTGLLAGASLGPEAPLTASSQQLGAIAGNRLKVPQKVIQLLIVASIGSLLACFFGSLLLVVVPVLLIYKQTKKLPKLLPLLVIMVTVLAAYGIVRLLDQDGQVAYGTLPKFPGFNWHDPLIALLLGFLIVFLAKGLQVLIAVFTKFVQKHVTENKRTAALLLSALVGGVLGLFYFLGGQTIEFSGSAGSELFAQNYATYSVWALVGLIVFKLLAISWSAASGYRGGLVFPSIYMGIVFGVLAEKIVPGWGGTGAMIGSISGMMSAATTPVLGIIFMAALLPLHLIWLPLVATIGTVLAERLLKRLQPLRT